MSSSRVAFVTGASSGIGRETALLLAKQGHAVACVSRERKRLDETVDAIRKADGRAIAIHGDVLKAADMEGAVATCAKELGGLDVLVPAAGVIGMGSVDATSLA
ncbi:MAG TPA: SDR family NAD(P)-dependent oxidoreductase, partial [Planctomycetota bacterium]|nr:SDR family NAD(P)-dependent oxidoreductase [Planctomycetota bacterium]